MRFTKIVIGLVVVLLAVCKLCGCADEEAIGKQFDELVEKHVDASLLTTESVADEENAVVIWSTIPKYISAPKQLSDEAREAYEDVIDPNVCQLPIDEAREELEEFVTGLEPYLMTLSKGLERPYFCWIEFPINGEYISLLGHMRALTYANEIRAHFDIDNGEYKSALMRFEEVVRVGRHLSCGKNDMITYMVGINIERSAYEQMVCMADSSCGDEVMGDAIRFLSKRIDRGAKLKETMQSEAALFSVPSLRDYWVGLKCGSTDDIREELAEGCVWSAMLGTSESCPEWLDIMYSSEVAEFIAENAEFMFIEETLADLNESCLFILKHAEDDWVSWSGRRKTDIELRYTARVEKMREACKEIWELVKKDKEPRGKDAKRLALAFRNTAGLQDIYYFGRTLMMKVRTQLAQEMALIQFAIRLYERRHGELPNSLEALVEAGIIKSVPIDPFSGKQICYDVERRIIWSVGEDCKDDGGIGTGKIGVFDDIEDKDIVRRIPELVE